MDLEKALQFLATQAVKAEQRKTFRPEAEPKHVYFMATGEDIPERIEAKAAPIDAAFKSIDSLACFVGTEGGEYSAVWYSSNRIVAVLDHAKNTNIAETDENGEAMPPSNGLDNRRERGTMTIEPSPQWTSLIGMNQSKAWKQGELIFLLRTVFVDCLSQAGDIMTILRSIKFAAMKDSAGDVGRHGTGSIGKSLRKEIANVDAIPEQITLEVPAFAGQTLPHSLDVRVRMVLEGDPETESFKFFPLPGEMPWAEAQAEANLLTELGRRLDEHGAKPRIYHGSPEK